MFQINILFLAGILVSNVLLTHSAVGVTYGNFNKATRSATPSARASSLRTAGLATTSKTGQVKPYTTNSANSARIAGLHANSIKGISSKLSSNYTSSSPTASSDSISELETRVNHLETELNNKQDILVPGEGIDIDDNTISLSQEATDFSDKMDEMDQKLDDLQDIIGDANSGLIQQINSLESASHTYNAGRGIVVTPDTTTNNSSTIGLDVNTSPKKMYVFKTDANGNGTWQALEVEYRWDPEF